MSELSLDTYRLLEMLYAYDEMINVLVSCIPYGWLLLPVAATRAAVDGDGNRVENVPYFGDVGDCPENWRLN